MLPKIKTQQNQEFTLNFMEKLISGKIELLEPQSGLCEKYYICNLKVERTGKDEIKLSFCDKDGIDLFRLTQEKIPVGTMAVLEDIKIIHAVQIH